MKVLFTNAGRRTYLIDFALNCEVAGRPPEIYVSDCVPDAPALHVSERTRKVLFPMVLGDEKVYAEAVLLFARSEGIDLIIPLSDLELHSLALLKPRFEEIGCAVAVCDAATIENCMDKQKNYAFCRANDLPTPASFFSMGEFVGAFPVVQKKIRGSGSDGLRFLRTPQDLGPTLESGFFLQQCVDGQEYGVDILNDLDGNFVSLCVKRKLAMRAGETDRAAIARHPKIEALARLISVKVRHVGNLDVDIIETPAGDLFCLDFNPRFGGGYPTSHLAGMNYLQALIDLASGRPPKLPAHPDPITTMKGISLFTIATVQ